MATAAFSVSGSSMSMSKSSGTSVLEASEKTEKKKTFCCFLRETLVVVYFHKVAVKRTIWRLRMIVFITVVFRTFLCFIGTKQLV